MRAVVLDMSDAMLDERRRLGLDRRDELWDGELHMVPPASEPHQHVGTELLLVLAPLAERQGLRRYYETGLFHSEQDYRVPDQQFARAEHVSERGTEGAELVVEIRSPDDETYAKIDWYAARGVHEMLIVHPIERRVELLRNVGGRLLPVTADADGAVRCEALDVSFATVDGPGLRVAWADGETTI